MDQPHHPTTAQKVARQLFRSTPPQCFGAFEGGQPRSSLYQSQYKYGTYSNAGFAYPSQMTCDFSVVKCSDTDGRSGNREVVGPTDVEDLVE